MSDNEHDDLRATFAQLRENDATTTPPFEATVARARATPAYVRRRFAARALPLVAAAAMIVLALGLAREVTRRVRASRFAQVEHAPSITAWSSPTQGLLRTSGTDLLAPSPLLSSVLGGSARAANAPRKGE